MLRPGTIVAVGITGFFGLIGIFIMLSIVTALPLGNMWWLISAIIVILGGEVAIKFGGLNEKVTRGAAIALGVTLTIIGLMSFFSGMGIGDWIGYVSTLPNTIITSIGLTTDSPWAWFILFGIATLTVAYLVGLIHVMRSGAAYWTKLAFGIVTTLVVVMLLGWLGRMIADAVLGEVLTEQLITGAQLNLQDGARTMITDDGRLTLEPVWVFDWGTFIGWVFIGTIILMMMIQLFKGNKLITVPLGIVGLIFFLVVGGYQAYKLEPIRESFEAVGAALPSAESLRGLGGSPRPTEIRVTFPPTHGTNELFNDRRAATMQSHDMLIVRVSTISERGGVSFVSPPLDYYTCAVVTFPTIPEHVGTIFTMTAEGNVERYQMTDRARAYMQSGGFATVDVEIREEIRSTPCPRTVRRN